MRRIQINHPTSAALLSVWAVCLALGTGADAQQPARRIYDDLGRLSKVIETNTGQCAVYEYDAVGNILSIARQTNCVSSPVITTITPTGTPNCFVATGQSLLAATVSVDVSGVSVTDLRAADTTISFCLATLAPVCTELVNVSMSTVGGSSASLPVTIRGAQFLSQGELRQGTIGAAGESDRFCLAITSPAWVAFQATATAIQPCLNVSSSGGVLPGGSLCGPSPTRLDLNLGAGEFLVDVSDNGANDVGAYTLRYDPISVTVEAADADASEAGPATGAFRFTRTGPTSAPLVVSFTRTGTATAGSDYSGVGTSVTIPANQVSTTVTVVPIQDSESEDDETVIVTLAAGNYTIGDAASATVNITDNRGQTGVLTNGANHTGVISVSGALDVWTFTAAAGARVALSLGETAPFSDFTPWLRVLGPTGTELASEAGALVAQANLTVPVAGTYTVLVGTFDSGRDATGSYTLTLVQTPGSFVVPAGDDGGALTNGANHTGTLFIGDLDVWTFTAAAGDAIALSVGETAPFGDFTPWLRVWGPTGTELASDAGALVAQANLTATVGGTYTVLIGTFDSGRDASGSYTLALAQTPGPFVVPAGDDGGALTNGANHTGTLFIGDLDVWTFTAAAGDAIALSVGETAPFGDFTPWLRVRGPTGTELASDAGPLVAQANLTATVGGTYTVLVGTFDSGRDAPGSYTLTLAQAPGAFVVAAGDDGGALTNGANHTGTLFVGDLDVWTFTAAAGARVALSLGETAPFGDFTPWLRVWGPTGTELASDAGALVAQANLTATVGGTYTVLVGTFDSGRDATGSYTLTLAQTPGSFVVPAGDDGGALTNGANHTGTLFIGDLDAWTFTAAAGDAIALSVGATAPFGDFTPWLRVWGPTGTELVSDAGALVAQANLTATVGGTYTVLIGTFDSGRDATGSYTLTLAQTPGAFVVPAGDDGGALTNGANHTGTLFVGDLDVWTFTAAAGDAIALSVGETAPFGDFTPWLRVWGPTGPELSSQAGALVAQANLTATVAGTYTVLIGTFDSGRDATGGYTLTLAQTPGTFVVNAGDQGGLLTSGTPALGNISVGDLDIWSFTASTGQRITLVLTDVNADASFVPWLRLRGPNGAQLISTSGPTTAQTTVTLATSGTFVVIVGTANSGLDGTGDYQLTLTVDGP